MKSDKCAVCLSKIKVDYSNKLPITCHCDNCGNNWKIVGLMKGG